VDGGAFLQDDKAEPAGQEILRSERERRQDADLDCAHRPHALSDSEG